MFEQVYDEGSILIIQKFFDLEIKQLTANYRECANGEKLDVVVLIKHITCHCIAFLQYTLLHNLGRTP